MNRAVCHLDQLAAGQFGVNVESIALDLWVPGEAVSVFQVDAPKVTSRKLIEMLPWLLEDKLLRPVDELEFTAGPRTANEQLQIFVLQKSTLNQWLMMADNQALHIAAIAPDFLALSFEEGRYSVCVQGGRMLVRTGISEGFAASPDIGWEQLQLLCNRADDDLRISLLTDAELEIPDSLVDRTDQRQGRIDWSFTEFDGRINLLPAERRRRAASAGGWMPALGFAALLVVSILCFMVVQSWRWQQDALELEAGLVGAYQSLFGEPPQISERGSEDAVAIRVQAQNRMALLEHQYLTLSSSPLTELRALDTPLSNCRDCAILSVSQDNSGLILKSGDIAALKSRIPTLEDFSLTTTEQRGSAGGSMKIVQETRR